MPDRIETPSCCCAAAAAAQAGLRLSPYAVARLASESAPLPEPWPIAARDSPDFTFWVPDALQSRSGKRLIRQTSSAV